MSAVPVFQQQSVPSLYALSTTGDAAVAGLFAGYRASPGSALGTSASTRAVWEDVGGYYLFLGAAPPDLAAFTAALDDLRPNLGPPSLLRALWVENPADPARDWRLQSLLARAQGSGASISWTMPRAVLFGLGTYGLLVNGAAAITYLPDSSGGGIAFAGGGAFSGPAGGAQLTSGSLALPFSGARTASFTATLTVTATASPEAANAWEMFRVGTQYAAPPDPASGSVLSNGLLFQPMFAAQGSDLGFGLSFDPLNPLVAARTALDLAPGGVLNTDPHDTFLRTTLGYGATLTAVAAQGGLPVSRFAFGSAPAVVGSPAGAGVYHLSPDGAFALTVVPPANAPAVRPPDQLLMGLSGLEYVQLPSAGPGDYRVVFRAGQPGYAPGPPASAAETRSVAHALTDAATTSHATILPKDGSVPDAVYYAQPREAPIYSGRQPLAPGFLDFNPMPSSTLTTAGPPAVFPVGFFAGLGNDDAALARSIEATALAPYRRYRISEAAKARRTPAEAEPPARPVRRDRAATDPLGVTPQGLVAELTPDFGSFDGLLLGNMPGTTYPKVDLTAVTGDFRDALQSSQLFFVAADPDVLMSGTSVRYTLGIGDTARLLALGVPQANVTAVLALLHGPSETFDTEAALVDRIGQVATPPYLPHYLDVAGVLRLEMDGWTFQLSPRSWRSWEDQPLAGGGSAKSPTILIAKFCNKSLSDMVSATTSWAWPEVAQPPLPSTTIADTQAIIEQIFAEAAADDAPDAYKRFHETVVTDPAWNGFLFLNAPIELSEMPQDLQFVTAGIDLGAFYAHHVGFSQTSYQVSGAVPVLEQTAAFGLIDYVDRVDLYAEGNVDYDFKTLQLRAEFANASLRSFSARVELLMNRFFGDHVTKTPTEHGNNLVLDGSYQRIAGTTAYQFNLEGQNAYTTQASVLNRVIVQNVVMQTRHGTDATGKLTADFSLAGALQFVAAQLFDPYSFGPDGTAPGEPAWESGLSFSGLVVSLEFDVNDPAGSKRITVSEDRIAFDLANSRARPGSLVTHFPLTLQGLVSVPGAGSDSGTTSSKPEDLGYRSIGAPMQQTPLEAPWYGLSFNLDLGTLGALMGSAGLSVQVLAAWQPGADGQPLDPPQYLGIKLPSAKDKGMTWPLQGVLSLAFRSFQMRTYVDDAGAQVYLLRLQQLALSILGLSFPPGNNAVVLFGNPDQSGASKLGWYAAYTADKKKAAGALARPGRHRPAPELSGAAPLPTPHPHDPKRIRAARQSAARRRGDPSPGGASR